MVCPGHMYSPTLHHVFGLHSYKMDNSLPPSTLHDVSSPTDLTHLPSRDYWSQPQPHVCRNEGTPHAGN